MPNDNDDLKAEETTASETEESVEEKEVSPESTETGEGEQELIEKPVSERGKNRISEIANERNLYKEKYEQLLRGEVVAPAQPSTTDIIGTLEKDLDKLQPEYTGDWVSDLEKARHLAKEEAKAEMKAELRFEREISELQQAYPELDDSKPTANQKLIGLINKQWELAGGLQSGQSFKKFVGEIMETLHEAKNAGKEETVSTLNEQLKEQAVSPSMGGSKETKSFNEMSVQELEAMAGYAPQ